MNIPFKGLPIFYEIHGDGLPLILLHGFNENIEVWNLITPTLKRKHKIILVDLPGFGKSPLPANLSIKYMADAVHRLITDLNITKPIVIGHSMGGYVTLALVFHHPDLLVGAGLFHSSAMADSDEKKANRIKTLEFITKNPIENFYKVFIPALFSVQNQTKEMIKLAENVIKTTHKNSAMAGTTAMLERDDRQDVLKNTKLPWLFIAGQNDEIIPVKTTTLQSSYCRKAMIEILENSGHMGMLEKPEKSSEIILKFADWCFNES